MGIEWVKPVMEFAKMVLPDLLSSLGPDGADQAFAELQKLYEKYKGDPAAARTAIKDVRVEVAQDRASADRKRAERRAARDKPKETKPPKGTRAPRAPKP